MFVLIISFSLVNLSLFNLYGGYRQGCNPWLVVVAAKLRLIQFLVLVSTIQGE